MMLRALYDLAQRQGLVEDPNYQLVAVDVVVRINEDGHLLSIEPSGERPGRGKAILVPRIPERAGKVVRPGFLVDKSAYAFGVEPEGKKDDFALRCSAGFHGLVDAAAAATKDTGLLALARFLAALPAQKASVLGTYPFGQDGTWTGSEYVAFRLDSTGELIHDRPTVRSYWASQRAEETASGPRAMCLVTSRMAVPERLHSKIKRLPNAQTGGASLVSFNDPAFESQGLSQGDNAPICREAVAGYVTALNWLLERTPTRRHRYGVPIGDDAVLVFWTCKESNVTDWLTALLPDGPDVKSEQHAMSRVVEEVGAAISKGRSPEDDNPFYAVTLSGHARVIVRDWFETTAAQVRHNLQQFIADLRIGSRPLDLPLPLLLASLDTKAGKPPADLMRHLLRSAFRGDPLPRQLLLAALARLRLPAEKNESLLLYRRCALIKVALLRSPLTSKWEVTVSLDESNRSVPYLLGRLFAVLEQLQEAALGSALNTTIRDRYFGAASTTPGLVFPRLLKLSVHHAAKAEGLGKLLERSKASIVAALPATPLPRLFTPEEQGMFAIGYYHQRDKRFEKRAESVAESAASA